MLTGKETANFLINVVGIDRLISQFADIRKNPTISMTDIVLSLFLMPFYSLTSLLSLDRIARRASFKKRYFLYHNWEWKLVYLAELDLLQLFNVIRDPGEKNNLLNEEPQLAAQLQKKLFDYLKKVEGKTYRALND